MVAFDFMCLAATTASWSFNDPFVCTLIGCAAYLVGVYFPPPKI